LVTLEIILDLSRHPFVSCGNVSCNSLSLLFVMLLHPSLISKQIFVSSDISFPWHLPKVFASHVAFVLNSLGGKKDREECVHKNTRSI
jgi:hypothetical protein